MIDRYHEAYEGIIFKHAELMLKTMDSKEIRQSLIEYRKELTEDACEDLKDALNSTRAYLGYDMTAVTQLPGENHART